MLYKKLLIWGGEHKLLFFKIVINNFRRAIFLSCKKYTYESGRNIKRFWAFILLMGGFAGSMLFFQEKPVEYRNLSNDRIQREQHKVVHLSADSTVGEIMDHPAFAGFSRFLLPEETGCRMQE